METGRCSIAIEMLGPWRGCKPEVNGLRIQVCTRVHVCVPVHACIHTYVSVNVCVFRIKTETPLPALGVLRGGEI